MTDSGVTVDAGRISGDSALVRSASVVYDKSGALLIFEMNRISEYSLTMNENVVTMEAVDPRSLYNYVVVLDPGDKSEAAGVCADVADRSAQLLYQEGIRVYLTDTSPESETAVTPAQLMEETGADIYIGLDVAHDGPAYHGIRTYYDPLYYIPGFGSIELSESCLKNTAISVSNRALGISEAPQGNVLYEINATLLIIGNADNQDEYALLTEDSYRERLANGIYETVKESAGMMGDV
jgi:N-acetylmuramoyl-L-alanine amidase